tara:strand:- start:12 stop:311 length:300 start_codon:yes stop_codon:yes gene_type:complete
MVAGDIVNYCADQASGAAYDFQPAATVQVCIFSCSSETNDATMGLTDGTVQTTFWNKLMPTNSWQLNGTKFLIDNTNYLRITNTNAATQALGFSGIQIK